MRRAARTLVAAALVLAACDTSRTRPGPPTVTIDPPTGSTVYSPDTLRFSVTAQDPDGLDSVTVGVLDTAKAFSADFNTEATVRVSILVPAGFNPGFIIRIVARATDLTGAETVDTASVTVIRRP